MSTPSIKVLLAVTSPIALSDFDGATVLVVSAKVVQEYSGSVGLPAPITVVAPKELASPIAEILRTAGIEHSILVCEPNDPVALAKVLLPLTEDCEIVLIHDSNRPLTPVSQFYRSFDALLPDVEAVRSAMTFTETLKVVSKAGFIEQTIDRSSVRRVSTPEVIRVNAIEFNALKSSATFGWFLPLKPDTRISYVEAAPESIRINSLGELLLFNS